MKLYCVRHGHALPVDENPERPLSQRGRQDAESVANHLQAQPCHVGQILHSSKARAKETAFIIARALDCHDLVECDTLLCEHMDIMPLVDMVEAWDQDTMLVGHMPFMPRLVNHLVAPSSSECVVDHFPTAAVACLERMPDNTWEYRWLISPKDLSS